MSNKPSDAFFQKLLATSCFAAIGVGVSVVSTVMPSTAWAAKVDFTPVVAVSETYTDNVQLDPPGAEQYDWVTKATAGFRFSGTGARARINLNYRPSLYSYARLNQTDLRHQLSNAGQIELVEDHLVLREAASISESFAASRGRISVSDTNLSGDRRQIYSFTVSPTLSNRFGSIASASLSYAFTGIYSDQPSNAQAANFSDSQTHHVTLSINSGEDFQRFRWGVGSSWRRETRLNQGSDVTNKTVNANASYNLVRSVALTGSVGYQDYEFSGSTIRNVFNWDVGLRLTPSRRLSLAMSYGDQANKRRLTFSGNYKPEPDTSINASYDETFQTSQSIIASGLPTLDNPVSLNGSLGGSFNFFGNTDVPGTTFTNTVFLQKRLSVNASHRKGRTNFSFSAYREIRTVGGVDLERALGARGTLSRTFSRVLTGNVSGNYIRRDDPNGRQDDIYLASANLNRKLGGGASAYLTYSFTKRTSNDLLSELQENAVTVGLTASF